MQAAFNRLQNLKTTADVFVSLNPHTPPSPSRPCIPTTVHGASAIQSTYTQRTDRVKSGRGSRATMDRGSAVRTRATAYTRTVVGVDLRLPHQ